MSILPSRPYRRVRRIWPILLLVPLAFLALARRSGRRHRAGRPAPARATRVRPYAPVQFTPPPPAYDVPPRTRMVRPYVLDSDHCARRRSEQRADAQARADQSRLGLAVLLDIAHPVAMWHCPVEGCQMSAPKPVTHPCPLRPATHGQLVEVAR